MIWANSETSYLTEGEERFHFFKYQERFRKTSPPIHTGPLIKFHGLSKENDLTNLRPPSNWFTLKVDRATKLYSALSFENFLKCICVRPCSTSTPARHDALSEIKHMAFSTQKNREEIVVPTSWKSGKAGRGHVIVNLDGLWQPLPYFLDTLRASLAVVNDSQDRKRLYEVFWKESRKPFRLLDLPGELRNVIYAFALGTSVEPGAYPPIGENALFIFSPYGQLVEPNRVLLLTCKQVCREVLYVLSQHTKFTFSRITWTRAFFTKKKCLRQQLQKRLEDQGLYSIRSKIKNVRLFFPFDQFLQFFGAQLSEEKQWRPSPAATYLRQLQLDKLELHIDHPAHMRHCDWLNGGCHETVVEWILAAAFPYIKNHPVKLTGYVKDSVKTSFMEKIEAAQKGQTVTQPTILATEL
ncbi:MAG: hypothetical protein M1821_009772 [Bathelium mastoideum]|nr:MAG: hypothetical protein M1821_009772 [Bathelium mastoideum]KAI9690469.1 MAG: hypothetical protein M1822_009432 [Bathelium mastoideum]